MKPEQFSDIEGVRWNEAHMGMPCVEINRDGLKGEVFLHGAHVTRWKPAENSEVLFLSPNSQFDPAKAIRGGVPICFPWFGPRAGLPQHGFARTRAWKLETVKETSDGIVVELSDKSDDETRRVWPFEFEIRNRVTFGSSLTMELEVRNTGDNAFELEEAQHSYFVVSDIEAIRVEGLEGALYQPSAGGESCVQNDAIKFTGEVDRVYLDTGATTVIADQAQKRRISVAKMNSKSTVVWNPWATKAEAMADLGPEHWRRMVCIETCNVKANAVRLAPGESHSMKTTVTVETL